MVNKDYDTWFEAFQQACAIAFPIKFKTVEEYDEYVQSLTEEIYDALIEESRR